MTTIKNGQVINAHTARNLIADHGVGYVTVEGALIDEELTAKDILNSDRFTFVVNYGFGVQLQLVGGRAVIVLNLKGHVENGEWVATA